MDICIIGAGYVGLVTAACLAEAGNRVACVEKDGARLEALARGHSPIREPGLDGILAQTRRDGRLRFAADLADGARGAEIVFIAVGTPPRADGRADLSGVLECAERLATVLDRETTVAVKSTVPVGTCERLQGILDASRQRRPGAGRVSVASNPEFLAEGRAVADFRRPDRIVIGSDDAVALARLRALYAPFDPGGTRVLCMDTRSAELAKYASNALLAARISLVNELARIAARVDADIEPVCRAAGADPRIGSRYLRAGAGFGGSCLPKDVLALIGMAEDHGEPAELLRSVHRVNAAQTQLLADAIAGHFAGRLAGRRIAVWGLAFKAGTDDLRDSPSVALVRRLLAAGAWVKAYDPAAGTAAASALPHARLEVAPDADAALDGAEALAVMTEWPEFAHADPARLAGRPGLGAVFDGRNLYEPEAVRRQGLAYYGIGRGRPPTLAAEAGAGNGKASEIDDTGAAGREAAGIEIAPTPTIAPATAHAGRLARHGACPAPGSDQAAGAGLRPHPAFRPS